MLTDLHRKSGRRPLWGMAAAISMVVWSCSVAILGIIFASRIMRFSQE